MSGGCAGRANRAEWKPWARWVFAPWAWLGGESGRIGFGWRDVLRYVCMYVRTKRASGLDWSDVHIWVDGCG